MAVPYLSKAEERELSRSLANYNKRLYDLSRQKRFENVQLPPHINIGETLKNVQSGRDVQRIRNTIARLDNPANLKIKTNNKGLKYLQLTERQLNADIAAANKQRAARRQELGSKTVKIGTQTMGTVESFYPERLTEYKPLSAELKNTPSPRALKSKFQAARKNTASKQELLKENLILAIQRNLGILGINAARMAASLSAAQIEQIFVSSTALDFDFLYSLENEMSRAEELEELLSQYLPNQWEQYSENWFNNKKWSSDYDRIIH